MYTTLCGQINDARTKYVSAWAKILLVFLEMYFLNKQFSNETCLLFLIKLLKLFLSYDLMIRIFYTQSALKTSSRIQSAFFLNT